jgi:hypothetical protein
VTIENAHPFEFEHVVGVHNGTVLKWSLKDLHGYEDFEVDSQIIYSHLSHSGLIEDVWKDADGALALVYWDKRTKKLNMIRNKERPLWVAYSGDNKTVLWASEVGMLYAAANRNGMRVRDAFQTVPNTLYTFSQLEGGTMNHTTRDLPPFVDKPYLNHYQNGNRNSRGGIGSYSDWEDWLDTGKPKALTPPKTPSQQPLTNAVIIIREWNDTGNNPSAVGFTKDGTYIRINIPLADTKVAKDKIVGRGVSGYYVAKQLYRMVMADKKPSFWCHWGDLQFVTLKAPNKVLRLSNNGFKLDLVKKTDYQEKFAPWFDESNMLTQDAFESKTECGCWNCKTVPNWGDKNALKWFSQANFVCLDCQSMPLMADFIEQLTKPEEKVG